MKKFLCIVFAVALAACAPIIDSAAEAARGGIKLHGHPVVVTAPVVTSNGGGATATITITTAQTAVTTVTASGTTPITYTKSGADAALFSIGSSTGVLALLTTQAAADYHVTVTATNTAGASSQNITLTVAPVITPPTITSNGGGSAATVNITTAQTAVTTVTATGSAPITYSIFGGINAGLFTINSSTGVLALLATQAAGSYQVVARALNTGGHADQTITVLVSAPSVAWQQVKIGAGGFVTGIQIASDGTQFVRTDTSGAYVRSSSSDPWAQVNVKSRMPGADATIACAYGAYAIAIAPSNSSRLYMYTGNPACYGYIFRSDDKGLTWARTGFLSVAADANDQGEPNSRLAGPHMAVDPANADIVFASTPSSGLWKTTDGGTTWNRVTAVGSGTTPPGAQMGLGHLIVFDPTSSVVGGVTQGIYVSTYGTGVYHTTTGGPLASGWTLTTSTPTTHNQMAIGPDGVLWLTNTDCCGGGAGSLLRYNGTWSTSIASGTPQLSGVAVDPNNCASAGACHVYALNYTGNLYITTNGGGSWVGPTAFTRSSATIPWLAAAATSTEAYAVIKFDPSQVNTMYVTTGVGVAKTNPPTTNVSVTWTFDSVGIESLATTFGTTVPSGPILLTSYDRPLWIVTDPTTYQSTYYPNGSFGQIDPGWYAEYAAGTSTLVETSTIQNGQISANSGSTWATFATQPTPAGVSAVGGNLAAASATNMVWLLSDDAGPYFTTNGGATWAPCIITGGTIGGGGWHHAQFYSRVALTVDRVLTTTYYLYNDGTGTNTEGVYKSTDGHTFARQASSTGQLVGPNGGAFHMISVPANAGHLFASSGSDPHGALPNTNLFYRSTDGGATWAAVPSVKSLVSFGYGKAVAAGYPAVYVLGYVSNVYGVWRSDDADQATPTWTSMGDGYPMGIYDNPSFITGDLNNYGRVYMGFTGTGYVYRDAN
jgi:hypothetical protein